MELKNVNESRNIIEEVAEGSIAEELEIMPGDILLSINEIKVKDIIDYKFLISDEYVMVEILKAAGEIWDLEIEKEFDEDLGIIFTNPLIDKAKSCQNKCVFCFIDQLPPNMRETLYFKDDDSRLSLLQGNFITLTNMNEDEINRIIQYRISPINISVHTTNPELRVKMLKNKNAGNVYDILKRFHEVRLEVNCQIVLVPGINDGEELKRTLDDLHKLYPTVESVAVVPIGITKYREKLEKVYPYNKILAEELLDELAIMQNNFLEKLGTRFVFPSDEFFAVSKRELPSLEEYEGFPQLENGVGLMKSFEYEIEEELNKTHTDKIINKNLIIATGTLAYDFMVRISKKIMNKYKGINLQVISIENVFFGNTITVSGLITANDLITKLENINADAIIIPQSMLRGKNDNVFLDNLTIEQVSKTLKTDILISPVDGKKFVDIISLGVSK